MTKQQIATRKTVAVLLMVFLPVPMVFLPLELQGMLATPLLLTGLVCAAYYAYLKGYHAATGLLWCIPLIGTLGLVLLPERRRRV